MNGKGEYELDHLMERTRVLDLSEVKALKFGELVYIVRKDSTVCEPAMVAKLAIPNAVNLVTSEYGGAKNTVLSYGDYGKHYELRMSDGLFVETPGGTLHVKDKHDPEYPGVWIEVMNEGKSTAIAMVEHIPGGEGLCSYKPGKPDEMQKEFDEVPRERIRCKTTGETVRPEEYETISPAVAARGPFEYEISEGFVTRSWPFADNDDAQNRTFHVFSANE